MTTNKGKLAEVSELLSPYGVCVAPLAREKLEIQSLDLKEIVKYAAESLAVEVSEPFIVEDAGLFVDSLNGFPGPYSSYVYKTLGVEGILTLLEGEKGRRASFRSAVAFHSKWAGLRIFEGAVTGEVARRALGSGGFGFDPIFVPEEGDGRTFAQMSLQEKNRLSHRGRAIRAFAEWLMSWKGSSSKGHHGLWTP
ncbi:MAG: XTP/dITP diphosphatase [Candidatus Bathyarchaeia archaeon]